MPSGRRTEGVWPPPKYQIEATFHAPREFVFRWCTDYRSDDARREGEHYERRVLARSSRRVVYEDMERAKEGWFWSRHVVRLDPGRSWHSDSVGSHREYSLDYQLSDLPEGGTRLVLTARRRPYGVGGPNPTKVGWERSVSLMWKKFGRSLERDYRASLGGRNQRRKRPGST